MKIKYFPCQPHCFAFGGFDMQMINALGSVRKNGIDASKLDSWSRDSDFDIIHLWGIGPHNYQIIDWSKKSGKLIIATVLLPYFGTLKSEIGNLYRQYFSNSFKTQINYYKKIDRIVVLNNVQADVLYKYYKVPYSKIDIIPNIVENKYFETINTDFGQKYDIKNYVLCTGNISARKNQLNLALACVNLNVNLVLIGNVLDGEEIYAAKLESLVNANDNILWIRELPKASDDLVAAYKSCRVFALASLDETQPISALEAVAMNKPLVLLDKKYAYQTYYNGAILCKSPTVKDIEIALHMQFEQNLDIKVNSDIIQCKEDSVGKAYCKSYSKLNSGSIEF